MICGVVDNGVCSDDPRVLVRLNEATKVVLDMLIPVGGMATYDVITTALEGTSADSVVLLPPQLENAIDVEVLDSPVNNQTDIREGWYEIINNSVYLDPNQQHDNPLIDAGLVFDPNDIRTLRRKYIYRGLKPNSKVRVTGAKRYIPLVQDTDFLIVQNIEALKLVILSIERNENAAPDEAPKYRQQALEILQGEARKHVMDPRNYMRRKAAYQQDMVTFPSGTLGYLRASLALDVDDALRVGKFELTWAINQAERRIMQRATFKGTITQVNAVVAGGCVYFPMDVQGVLAVDLCGCPIPIRSEFFPYLENGPGQFPCSAMLIDQGDQVVSGNLRRKYQLVGPCNEGQQISTICKLRWRLKTGDDLMVIGNYEAIRLLVTAKFLEAREQWKEALANQQQAFEILEKELRDYLSGIKHTPQIQTYGFGLGDVGRTVR